MKAKLIRPFTSLLPGLRIPETPPLGRLGDLEIRLAATAAEIQSAQSLRYRVFYEEMAAVADPVTQRTRRDADHFDRFCDHLLVIDRARRTQSGSHEIVGTYRLLRHDRANDAGGFYSEGEFDLAPLRRQEHLNMLELGRSCVVAEYRNRRTLELLWHGVWTYVLRHRADVMIGCASLEGTDPEKHALALSFLHHYCRAPEDWRVFARGEQRVGMDLRPTDSIDARAGLRALPPLIKGYLRLGAFVGDGAVIDRQFGTIDVAIVLPVEAIAGRYVGHYGADASRYAVKLPEKESARLFAA